VKYKIRNGEGNQIHQPEEQPRMFLPGDQGPGDAGDSTLKATDTLCSKNDWRTSGTTVSLKLG
jgi:hypothetical protein